MYKIGELKDYNIVQELKENFVRSGITFQIAQEHQNDNGDLYIISVNYHYDVEKAQEIFNTLIGLAQKYEIPPEYQKIHSIKLTTFTKNLILICCSLYILSFSGPGKDLFKFLSLSANPNLFLSEIKNGEFWRFFTPMFLHFSLLHILFNMVMLKDLGKIIEHSKGIRFFTLFVFITGAVSNLGQYMITGPFFGGMSGVIYAFFGLLWMEKTLNPDSEFALPRNDLILIIGWFFLCLFGLIGRIANTAHATGLVSGMLTGIFVGLKTTSNPQKFKKAFFYTLLSILLLITTLFVEYFRLKKHFYLFNFYP